jgi:large subunit ribosomal protein L22
MAEERKTQKPKAKATEPKAKSKPKAKATEPKAKSKPKAESKPKAPRKAPAKAKSEKPKAAPKRKAEPKSKSTPEARKPEPEAPVVRARARYVRVAPRKVRLVADQVRGLAVDDARALLNFSGRDAAADLGKLIDSAVASAEANHDLIADELRIAELTVDEGPTLRRYRPRALGRATRIDKRTCHISVALTPEELD